MKINRILIPLFPFLTSLRSDQSFRANLIRKPMYTTIVSFILVSNLVKSSNTYSMHSIQLMVGDDSHICFTENRIVSIGNIKPFPTRNVISSECTGFSGMDCLCVVWIYWKAFYIYRITVSILINGSDERLFIVHIGLHTYMLLNNRT